MREYFLFTVLMVLFPFIWLHYLYSNAAKLRREREEIRKDKRVYVLCVSDDDKKRHVLATAEDRYVYKSYLMLRFANVYRATNPLQEDHNLRVMYRDGRSCLYDSYSRRRYSPVRYLTRAELEEFPVPCEQDDFIIN